ncbi:MAG: hypothetical protein AAFZ07_23410, partial [Actinomycetota bacterium]
LQLGELDGLAGHSGRAGELRERLASARRGARANELASLIEVAIESGEFERADLQLGELDGLAGHSGRAGELRERLASAHLEAELTRREQDIRVLIETGDHDQAEATLNELAAASARQPQIAVLRAALEAARGATRSKEELVHSLRRVQELIDAGELDQAESELASLDAALRIEGESATDDEVNGLRKVIELARSSALVDEIAGSVERAIAEGDFKRASRLLEQLSSMEGSRDTRARLRQQLLMARNAAKPRSVTSRPDARGRADSMWRSAPWWGQRP